MQSNLKSRPVVVQLLFFVGIAFSIASVLGLFAIPLIQGITGISYDKLVGSGAENTSLPPRVLAIRVLLLVQFLGFFVIPCFLFASFSDRQPLRYLGLKRPEKGVYWVLGIAAVILSLPLVEYLGLLNRQLPFPPGLKQWIEAKETEASKTILLLLKRHTPTELVLNTVFIALFAGVGEELFFRGVLQRLFIRAFRSPWAGILLTAFIFSAIHMQFFGFVPRFMLGILLGLIYWYSGSLWVSIVAHFLYDALLVVLAYFQPSLATETSETMFHPNQILPLALVSAVLVGWLAWTMIRKSTVRYADVYRNDGPASGPHFTS